MHIGLCWFHILYTPDYDWENLKIMWTIDWVTQLRSFILMVALRDANYKRKFSGHVDTETGKALNVSTTRRKNSAEWIDAAAASSGMQTAGFICLISRQ